MLCTQCKLYLHFCTWVIFHNIVTVGTFMLESAADILHYPSKFYVYEA